MPNFSQDHINNQILKYCQILKEQDGNEGNYQIPGALQHNRGLCYAYSIIYSYMHNIGYGSWWESVLKALSVWDEKPESLEQEVLLFGAHELQPLKRIFDRAIQYLLYHQRFDVALQQAGARVTLAQDSIIFPHDETVPGFEAIASGTVTGTAVIEAEAQFIADLVYADNYILSDNIVTLSGAGHACSLRYDATTNRYYFYNCNRKKIVVTCTNDAEGKALLIRKLKKGLHNYIKMELAIFDNQPQKLQDIVEAALSKEEINKGNYTITYLFEPEEHKRRRNRYSDLIFKWAKMCYT